MLLLCCDQNIERSSPSAWAHRLKKKLGQKRARVARAADSDTDSSDDEADQLGDWTAIGWLGVKYTKRIVLPDFACVLTQTDQASGSRL